MHVRLLTEHVLHNSEHAVASTSCMIFFFMFLQYFEKTQARLMH